MTMTMAVARRRSSSIGWMSIATHYHRPSAVLAQLDPNKHIQDINSQVAQFRDLLINIGQPRDCPELRERIRKLRRSCVEACKNTSQLVLPQMRSAMDLGIPADSPNLVLLFFVSQLFLRELYKSKNLVRIVPMDMSGYYESKAGPSNIGNVISQILLCKQITPDFNEEEICSIRKDSEEISALIAELQEFMPQSEADTERTVALQELGTRPSRNNGNGKSFRWDSNTRHPSYFRGGFNLLCCAARPNYI
ncbi:uncharacterized protein LOC107266494 isoform X2 [Cephus cinctus]|nr:uncharacterized protein LOC107266494 isoform X2 [Cephus cinctus]XP_024939534.1 uncharacterized protein LOC107266494 isoform X2 [Cephus cinctus]XP_024939542.1 uncharacterized protein LOC107266494 isoform X2 [Cephus cinctus]XP_024939544.1 uncharacterized protein LOC107266494 isoform X2 [Cephus cinctus]XP_024939547.1 uncharacterized protein LOC107266494 isoform X2 [Cephus cinctus]